MIKAKGLKITVIKELMTSISEEMNSLIENLVGNTIEFDTSLFDYYVKDNLGIFVPILDRTGKQSIKRL